MVFTLPVVSYALVIYYSYDAIMAGSSAEILDAFMELQGAVVFSAEVFIWPDHTLAVCLALSHTLGLFVPAFSALELLHVCLFSST